MKMRWGLTDTTWRCLLSNQDMLLIKSELRLGITWLISLMLEVFWALKMFTPPQKTTFRCQDVFNEEWMFHFRHDSEHLQILFLGFPLVGNFEPFPMGPVCISKRWLDISQDPHQEGAQQHAKSKYPKYWVGFGGRATSHGLWIWFSMSLVRNGSSRRPFWTKLFDDHSMYYF